MELRFNPFEGSIINQECKSILSKKLAGKYNHRRRSMTAGKSRRNTGNDKLSFEAYVNLVVPYQDKLEFN